MSQLAAGSTRFRGWRSWSYSNIAECVDHSLYEEYETITRERVTPRDPDDWPVVVVALLLDFPIWTEDQDFFGSGVATWTTDRVELYLREE
jgi:predicted nucleic acid-binding protein